MSSMTTIKVPRALRDRLGERARREGTTLAGALEHALDTSEEQEFWGAVRESHRRPPTAAPAQEQTGALALRDNLADDDDDALGRDGW